MLAPHFDLPFRLHAKGAVCCEQDTFEDVANCVEAIVRTPIGFRQDNLTFGFPHLELLTQPVLSQVYTDIVSSQEPRAEIAMREHPDKYDIFIDRIVVEISTAPDVPEGVVIYGLHQNPA